MPEISVDVEIWCSCNEGLCHQSSSNRVSYGGHASPGITVEPCEKCLDKAREEGYAKGFDEGLKEA